MRAQASGCAQPDDTIPAPDQRSVRDELDSAQSALLALLLSDEHRELYSREELQRALSADPLTITDAIAELIATGLAYELDGFILASRAARSFDRLHL